MLGENRSKLWVYKVCNSKIWEFLPQSGFKELIQRNKGERKLSVPFTLEWGLEDRIMGERITLLYAKLLEKCLEFRSLLLYIREREEEDASNWSHVFVGQEILLIVEMVRDMECDSLIARNTKRAHRDSLAFSSPSLNF